MSRRSWPLVILILPVFTSQVDAVELMQWERLPLAVPLVVGQERVILLDQDVRVGVPGNISGKLRVQSIGGTVYLLPSEPIGPTRLQLQSVASGSIILLDIEAMPGDEALEPVRIATESESIEADDDAKPSAPVEPTPVPVTLTRYAAQNLYAPLRTVEPLPGARRVPVKSPANLNHLLPTESVAITPMAAWRLGDFWVTAVKIRNKSGRRVQLDPRQLQATLFGASFQHTYLGSQGTPEDTTVAYLITRGAGLEKAILLPAAPEGDHHEG